MNIFTFTGYAFWAGSVVVLIFQAIASIMHTGNVWKNHTLASLSGDTIGALIQAVPFEFLEKKLYYLVNDLPLYQLLLAAGVLFFVMGSFSRK